MGDILGANHFLRGHREERARFYWSRSFAIIMKVRPPPFRQPGKRSSAGRATPLLVHLERRVSGEFEEPGNLDRSAW